MEIKENVSLKDYTSWQVGGVAEFYCSPKNEEEVKQALKWSFENKKNHTILGGGTNTLISDRGIRGLLFILMN